jgi:hypothetical protein
MPNKNLQKTERKKKHHKKRFLNNATVKQTCALWFGPTLRLERRTLLPELAMAKKLRPIQ